MSETLIIEFITFIEIRLRRVKLRYKWGLCLLNKWGFEQYNFFKLRVILYNHIICVTPRDVWITFFYGYIYGSVTYSQCIPSFIQQDMILIVAA